VQRLGHSLAYAHGVTPHDFVSHSFTSRVSRRKRKKQMPSPYNLPGILALWPTAKTQLATVATDIATAQADLLLIEATRAQFVSFGASHVSEWLRTQLVQLTVGWQPIVAIVGGPARIILFAPEPSLPRDLSVLGERRPMALVDPILNLT
jgi:hypothetical protein